MPIASRTALLRNAVSDPPLERGVDRDAHRRSTRVAGPTSEREAQRILEATLNTELRDSDVARGPLATRRPDGRRPQRGGTDAGSRPHRAAARRRTRRSARTDRSGARPPRRPRSSRSSVAIRQGQVVVRGGDQLTPADIESITALGLGESTTDVATLGRLVPARGPGRRHAARLDLAVPPGALAPRQRARPDRPAAGRGDARAQADRRPGDPAVLRADRGDRDAPDDPARCVARHRSSWRSSRSSAAP